MGLSFLVFPRSYYHVLGVQLGKAVCIQRLRINRKVPSFLVNLRQQVLCKIFSLNFSLPNLFLLNLDSYTTRGQTTKKEWKGKRESIPLTKENTERKQSTVDSSLKSTFLIKKEALIMEWLQDTERILVLKKEESALQGNLEESCLENEERWRLDSSDRPIESTMPFKLSGIFIVTFWKGNKFFIGFLHIVATVVLFFVSSVFHLSKITYSTACRLGDGIHLVSLKFSGDRDSTEFDRRNNF